jgi:hypothetical protein
VGFRAGSDDESGEEIVSEAQEAPEAAEDTTTAGPAAKTPGSKRGIFLLLGGLVVAGIAAGWSWMKGRPKDEP